MVSDPRDAHKENGKSDPPKVRLVVQLPGGLELMYSPVAVKGLTPYVCLEVIAFLMFIIQKAPIQAIQAVYDQLPGAAQEQFKLRKASSIVLPG